MKNTRWRLQIRMSLSGRKCLFKILKLKPNIYVNHIFAVHCAVFFSIITLNFAFNWMFCTCCLSLWSGRWGQSGVQEWGRVQRVKESGIEGFLSVNFWSLHLFLYAFLQTLLTCLLGGGNKLDLNKIGYTRVILRENTQLSKTDESFVRVKTDGLVVHSPNHPQGQEISFSPTCQLASFYLKWGILSCGF